MAESSESRVLSPVSSSAQNIKELHQKATSRRVRSHSTSTPKSTSTGQRHSTRRKLRRSTQPGPQLGSTRPRMPAMQRSSATADEVSLTKTGRIKKARKGVKDAHICECGKKYSRAEHLRRHQQNHQLVLKCDVPDCNEKYHRQDLLQRHKEKHASSSGAVRSPQSSDISSSPTGPGVSVAPTPTPTLPSTGDVSLIGVTQADHYYSSFSGAGNENISPIHTTGPGYTAYPPFSQPLLNTTDPYDSYNIWTTSSVYSPSSGYQSPGPDMPFPSQYQRAYRDRSSSSASLVSPWASSDPSAMTTPISTVSGQTPYWASSSANAPILPMSTAPELGAPFRTADNSSYSQTFNEPIPAPTALSVYQSNTSEGLDMADQAILFSEKNLSPRFFQFRGTDYLENYWNHFHPNFPILHRPTSEEQLRSPLLRAITMALGAQYTDDRVAKKDSCSLHALCLKVIDRRKREAKRCERTGDKFPKPRLCDKQAILLIEIFTQFRGQRAPPRPSSLFKSMFESLRQDRTICSRSHILGLANLGSIYDNDVRSQRWSDWIEFHAKQRLLLACYILDSQQAKLFSRHGVRSSTSALQLPMPAPSPVWEAQGPENWASICQAHPTGYFVNEVLDQPSLATESRYCRFASALLVASSSSTIFEAIHSPALSRMGQVLNAAHPTQISYHATLIATQTPLRALFAVSGESWVLGQRLSPEAAQAESIFEQLKDELRTWAAEVSPISPNFQNFGTPAKEALKQSLQLLRIAITSDSAPLGLMEETAIYIAVLVLWAISYSIHKTLNISQPLLPWQGALQNVAYMQDASMTAARIPALNFIKQNLDNLDSRSFALYWNTSPIDAAHEFHQGVQFLVHWVRLRLLSTKCGGLSMLLDGAVEVLEKLEGGGPPDEWF